MFTYVSCFVDICLNRKMGQIIAVSFEIRAEVSCKQSITLDHYKLLADPSINYNYTINSDVMSNCTNWTQISSIRLIYYWYQTTDCRIILTLIFLSSFGRCSKCFVASFINVSPTNWLTVWRVSISGVSYFSKRSTMSDSQIGYWRNLGSSRPRWAFDIVIMCWM